MKHLLHKFKNDNSGNVAMILAICLIPLMGFVGFALDYNQASRQKALLQSASDMAALYIAKMKDPNKASKAQEIAETMVREMAKEAKITDLNIKGAVVNKKVTVTADAASPNFFSQMFGFKNVRVGVLAEAIYAAPKIEVGLVLDNTGSMQGEGMAALIPATHNLLDLFSKMSEDGEDLVKASFVTYDDEIMQSAPLSSDWNKMHNMANEMFPRNSTAIGMGMLESYGHLKASNTKVKQFMIVLTDGAENSRLEVGMPFTCPKVRADNIIVFTVGLGVELDAQALTNCAGDTKRYFPATDASSLDVVFKKIFAEISGLRLTR